ncbi:HAD family hydrolase [Aquicella lusitana]|uniref:Phosphoglycolate phosphatase n=1 Tax=Aquicella lusitana TaxID=254246 RepID=A0A370GZU8_9COXI|nr:HAD-IA family hydrolase [Aquicella lusitana]RDI48801.1 phosphoglycolate phosphatase [Aquicella lusitana]VVC73229.1 Phosphoglycolate phosphatase [Aquicella lusitana]
MTTITTRAVLFDLDGTLLDTAPDLVYALNRLRQEQGFTDMPLSEIRPIISHGSKAMVKKVLGIEENDPAFPALRERFLELYQNHLADSTRLFPDIDHVLNHLDQHRISWGIVTNKLSRQTFALLKALNFEKRPQCVICGDSLPAAKPDPAPIRYACELLNQDPQECIYIGDAMNDMIASKAAGTRSLVALYGYIGEKENPFEWQADGYIHQPAEIIKWL